MVPNVRCNEGINEEVGVVICGVKVEFNTSLRGCLDKVSVVRKEGSVGVRAGKAACEKKKTPSEQNFIQAALYAGTHSGRSCPLM
jgi:hypothetical protein